MSEQELHDAVAEFPELIPHERFGLGRLTVLAREFPCAAGYIDLLLIDEFGRIVICEVKKGTENNDVRKVIAQMLDYGAALWKNDIEEFEHQIAQCEPRSDEPMMGIVSAKHGTPGEPEAFRLRAEQCLAEGDFVFLYVVRDLDPGTERVVNYLTTRPRIALFVVEVDNYVAEGVNVLVPRAVGVPPWATGQSPEHVASNQQADEVMRLMDDFAKSAGIVIQDAATGRRYYSRLGDAYIGVYRSGRGTEIGLQGLEDAGHSETASEVRQGIRAAGLTISDEVRWPAYRCDVVLDHWTALAQQVLPLFLGAEPEDPALCAD